MMNIYVFGFLITMMFSMMFNTGVKRIDGTCEIEECKRNRSILTVVFILFWGFLLCFRNVSVGTDTGNYVYICQKISKMSLKDLFNYWEFVKFPIYILFNKCLSFFSNEASWYIFINSLVFIVGVAIFFLKNSRNVAMSFMYFITLHFYFMAMNINRQFIAVMLVLWCYHYAIREQYRKSYIILMCAILVHNTALIAAIILLICKYVKEKKHFEATIILGVVFSLALKVISKIFIIIFPIYADYFSAKSDFSIINDTSSGNRIYTAFFILGILFVFYIWRKVYNANNICDEIFWKVVSISILGLEMMIFQNGNEIFARLENYFTIFIVLMLPEMIERFVKKDSRNIFYAMTMGVLFFPFYVKLSDYLPYSMWLMK